MRNADVFTDIARKYDRINRVLSLGQDQKWRQRVMSRLPAGRLLDLGAGTGAANPIFGESDFVALDPSPQMLALNGARSRVVAVGERLPFRGGVFDAVFSAYVLRNLESVVQTLHEIARVLRPGGKAGIVDLGRPLSPVAASIHRAGSAVVLNGVGLVSGAREEYRYLQDSLDKLPPAEELFVDGPLAVDSLWRMGPLGFVYGAVLTKGDPS